MAQMYPVQLDPATKSAAERRLYGLFQQQLGHGYHIFHSVKWIARDREGNPRDGEADFILAHPEQGILVIEVKGGGIQHNPTTRMWMTRNSHGEIHPIRDPIEQAINSKYALLSKLRPRSSRYILLGHAVAFPDIVVADTKLGLALSREIILDATDLNDLAGWFSRVMNYWRGSRTNCEPGMSGIRVLKEELARAYEFKPALWSQIHAEQQELLHLTEGQYYALDLLNSQHQALIRGFAGSGKTLLAAEKASRLARQGFRVLLTCYNKLLAQELRVRLGCPTNLDIFHFHDLCTRMAKEAGLTDSPGSTETAAIFEREMPEKLMQASTKLKRKYDAIIVDEGQDFQELWWVALQDLLRTPSSIFYIFYDDNQRIYAGAAKPPFPFPSYPLIENCRTTKVIHEQIVRFYTGEMAPRSHGPEGKPIEVVRYPLGHLQQALERQMIHLLQKEGIPPKDIMILSPFSHQKSQLKSGNVVSWSHFPDEVILQTIHSAKGLERPVVVLVELERWFGQQRDQTQIERLLYIACSRACNYLLILLAQPAPRSLVRLFCGEEIP